MKFSGDDELVQNLLGINVFSMIIMQQIKDAYCIRFLEVEYTENEAVSANSYPCIATSIPTGRARKPVDMRGREHLRRPMSQERAYISEISVQYFYITVNDLQRHEFVIVWADSTDEEERSVSTIDDFRIFRRWLAS